MTGLWSDLDVRARGLASRLLGRARLEALARSSDLHTLGAELERSGYERITDEASATSLDLSVRRTMATRSRVLERWAGDRASVLAVLFEEQDVRNLRALLRGALSKAPSASRLACTLPTKHLPEGALAELSRLHDVREIDAVLLAWRHPYAAAIAVESHLAEPSAFRLEAQLHVCFAERALAAARDRAVRAFVQQTIDLRNAFAAIELAAQGATEASEGFVPSGARIDRARFDAAANAGDGASAARSLAHVFARTELHAMLLRHADHPAALEDAALAILIGEQSRAARRDPLGPAPLLAYVLRQRAEAADVRRIIVSVSLGVPATTLISQLVTT